MLGLIVAVAVSFGLMVGAAIYLGLLLILLVFRAASAGLVFLLRPPRSRPIPR